MLQLPPHHSDDPLPIHCRLHDRFPVGSLAWKPSKSSLDPEAGNNSATKRCPSSAAISSSSNSNSPSSVYNRRPPSLFGEHCEILRWRTFRKTLKRWWGRLEKRRMATESGGEWDGDETGDETGSPGDKTGDKTARTAGDKRDGGDRWGNVYERRGVRIWWGRDGSAWRVAFSCGI